MNVQELASGAFWRESQLCNCPMLSVTHNYKVGDFHSIQFRFELGSHRCG